MRSFYAYTFFLMLILAAAGYGAQVDLPMEGVTIQKRKGGIEAWVGQKLVLVYNTATVMPPEGQPEYFKRSGFIHPLNSPKGAALTDDFPAGHTHQHGMFFAWTKATFHGDEIDFWNQHKGTGTVEHIEVLEMTSGLDSGLFKIRQQEVSLEHGPALEDIWTVKILNRKDPFEIEIEIEQKCLTDAQVVLEEYHYGGFAFRGTAQWNADDGDLFKSPMQIVTREGKNKVESNHTRPGWIAAWGSVDKGSAGVAILDHPDNFRFPQPVRIHPRMPYFVFSPPVLGRYVLEPGKDYHSRYKVLLFDGEPDTENLERLFEEFGKK